MITKAKAAQLAADHVKKLNAGCAEEFALAADRMIERDQCFVFFYNTKRFLETGDNRYRLAGNGPILVSKRDGYLHAYGSNRPVEVFIADFERQIAAVV
jgi:hypothetical protein